MNKFPFPLVNAHAHAAMVGFRGLAEDLPLDKWLSEHIWPAEAQEVNADFVYRKSKEAIAEMRKNGIRAFADMYFFEEEVARAAEEEGMTALVGEGILDFPTPSAKTPEEAFGRTEELIGKYSGNRFVRVAVAPHSVYTVSEANLLKAKEMAERHGVPLHIHLAETRKEVDDCLAKNGLTPIAYLDKLGLLGPKTIAAHCVWANEEDIDILARKQVKVVHCPLSNLKLGSGIAPIARMIEKGVSVSLGTDGAASSNRLDIWEAGKFAALLQKGVNHDPELIPAKEAMRMMTVNGMEALGLDELSDLDRLSIEKGLEGSDGSLLYGPNSDELFG